MKTALLILALFSLGGCGIVDSAMKIFSDDNQPTKTIIVRTAVANKKLTVEIADDEEERMRGLMERKELPTGHGMLFIFEDETPRRFWMKNTLIPLDIIFFNSRKEIVSVVENMAPCPPAGQAGTVPECPSYTSQAPAMFALEVPAGFARKNAFHIGDTFSYGD